MAERGATATTGSSSRPLQELSTNAAIIGGGAAAAAGAGAVAVGGLVLGKELAGGGSPLSDVNNTAMGVPAVVVAPSAVGVAPPVDEVSSGSV